MELYSANNLEVKKKGILYLAKRDWQFLVIMILPFIFYVIFSYIPMYGIIIAFKDFSPSKGILGSEWIGLKNFIQFFQSYYFYRTVRNTFLIGFYSLVFGFPIPIIFALALNEIRIPLLKRITQSVSYIPHFISIVVVVGMMYNFLSVNYGVINELISRLGLEKINFMESSRWFRTLYVGSGIWQGYGFGAIIYLATISGINPELYSAIEIDGGNRLQKIIYITLPCLRPTIIVLLILSFGSIFSVGFEKIMLMYSPTIYDVSDVISTYSYRKGILDQDYGFATAVGLFNTIVNFLMLVIFNTISRKYSETSLW